MSWYSKLVVYVKNIQKSLFKGGLGIKIELYSFSIPGTLNNVENFYNNDLSSRALYSSSKKV